MLSLYSIPKIQKNLFSCCLHLNLARNSSASRWLETFNGDQHNVTGACKKLCRSDPPDLILSINHPSQVECSSLQSAIPGYREGTGIFLFDSEYRLWIVLWHALCGWRCIPLITEWTVLAGGTRGIRIQQASKVPSIVYLTHKVGQIIILIIQTGKCLIS